MKSIAGLVFFALVSATTSLNVKIGVISSTEIERQENSQKIWSIGKDIYPSIQLEPIIQEIPWWNEEEVAKAVCKLAEQGVRAIAVQAPPRLSPVIASYADNLHLPIVTTLDVGQELGHSQVSLLPDTTDAAASLIKFWKWKSFAFVYEADVGAEQLGRLLDLLGNPPVEPFWRAHNADDAYAFLIKTPWNITNLVMATSEATADELFNKLRIRRKMQGLLLKPVGVVKAMNTNLDYVRLTKFSFLEEGSKPLIEFENRWKTLQNPILRSREKEFPDSALLNSDISRVLYSIFGTSRNELSKENSESMAGHKDSFDCYNYSAGVSFNKNEVKVDGVTGVIRFDEEGRRIGFKLDIVELAQNEAKKIATWSDDTGLNFNGNIPWQENPTYAAQQSNEPPIRVTSFLTSPYLMKKENGEFEGFIMDLIQGLENVTGLHFDVHLVKDNRYGTFVNNTWNGMIGELLRNETDVALADLTVTSWRSEAVHFSRPFWTAGLRILVKKTGVPQATSFGAFSFLTVWPIEMWLVIVLAVIVFSASGYFISRFIGAPDRVRALESKGTDSLSPCGSFWFTISALFQRDTGIYPRTFTHRLWAIIWWTFCFFIMVSYISALTSALIQTRQTITSTHMGKTSQELLKDCLTKGWPKIGTIGFGSTTQFFKASSIGLYRDFGNYLSDNPDVTVKSSSEAIARVRSSNGSYAFLTDSPSIEFMANQEPCDIVMTSGYLSSRLFAPAIRKDSRLKDTLDKAILTLTEDGTLRKLYERWWQLNTHCEDPNMDALQHAYNSSTKLHEVSGIFYILCIGFVVSIITTLIERYLARKRVTTIGS